MVWPDFRSFGNIETAFLDVSRKVGGEWLFQAMALILIVANVNGFLCFAFGWIEIPEASPADRRRRGQVHLRLGYSEPMRQIGRHESVLPLLGWRIE